MPDSWGFPCTRAGRAWLGSVWQPGPAGIWWSVPGSMASCLSCLWRRTSHFGWPAWVAAAHSLYAVFQALSSHRFFVSVKHPVGIKHLWNISILLCFKIDNSIMCILISSSVSLQSFWVSHWSCAGLQKVFGVTLSQGFHVCPQISILSHLFVRHVWFLMFYLHQVLLVHVNLKGMPE